MITIKDFCEKHWACQDGKEWAMSQGVTTMAELWALDMRPDWRVWIATREDAIDPNKQRLFACFCVRQIWHLLTDPRSRRVVEVAEQHAAGQATDEELAAARRDADDVVAEIRRTHANPATIAAAEAAAAAAWRRATGTAALWAAEASWGVEGPTAWGAQAQWLIDNINKGEIA